MVALDLGRMNRLTGWTPPRRPRPCKRAARAGGRAAARPGAALTLGHLPQSFEHATIGGFAATRSAGQASAGYGRFDDMVLALTARRPRAARSAVGRAPASAAGPDLRQLLLGSEGTFGVITEVTVRCPAPARRRCSGRGVAVRRPRRRPGRAARAGQSGAGPSVRWPAQRRDRRRRSSACYRGAADGLPPGHQHTRERRRWPRRGRRATARVLRDARRHAGRRRAGHRLAGAAGSTRRTCATRCSDAGVLAETLETATSWATWRRAARSR